MKTEAYKSVCARLFEGGGGRMERERKISLTFDLRGPLRLDFIAYTDMADLATVCQIYIYTYIGDVSVLRAIVRWFMTMVERVMKICREGFFFFFFA